MATAKVKQKDRLLGKKMRKIRDKLDISQADLADMAGLSTTFIGMIEVGLRRPSLKSLERIAKALKVKVKDLISF